MTRSSAAWEQLRHVTLDQLVTHVKLAGSAAEVNGFTTPEGWPFTIIVAVGKPGNERAVELARDFHDKMVAASAWTNDARNPDFKEAPKRRRRKR